MNALFITRNHMKFRRTTTLRWLLINAELCRPLDELIQHVIVVPKAVACCAISVIM